MTPTSPSSPASFPLALYLADQAAEGEIAALVQYTFFRPYLAELLEACVAVNLDLIVLKGAALAETVYPRPSLRFFGDLDVLVRGADCDRARAVLEGLGYTPDALQWEEMVQGRYCQTNFFKHPERGAVVAELHTELLNNPFFFGRVKFDAEGTWERARRVTLAGEEAWVLGPEDQLLHLCLHLACHTLAAPSSLRDIEQICQTSEVDWPLLLTIARQAQATRACFAGLLAANRLLGTPVPDSVLAALAPRFGGKLLRRLALTRAADRAQGRTEFLRFPLLLCLLDTPAARWSALLHLFVPTPRWLITHYYFEVFQEQEPMALTRHAYYTLLGRHWMSLVPRLLKRIKT